MAIDHNHRRRALATLPLNQNLTVPSKLATSALCFGSDFSNTPSAMLAGLANANNTETASFINLGMVFYSG
ncbi:hypothetical protein [Methylomonas koyamae]|uniref:hypothetical protein n=1 Tax=Methylomonas koyamae TaxID=702114 RepID=UPI00210F5CE6|nr:hypothetical protein [Methylomonas koyamae]